MRVALYARVSTNRQALTQSIEQQLDRLRQHVIAEGWPLSDDYIFRDDGHSGATLNRPGLDSLRDKVRAAEVDRIVLTAPDRLARNARSPDAAARGTGTDRLSGAVSRPTDDRRPA